MALISKKEKDKLYLKVKHVLGYPRRIFELTDEMLDTYLELAIEDYSAIVNEWLIEQQWVNLQSLDVSNADFLNAFATKSLDFEKSFTYAYSRQVGLGANAPTGTKWELKRGFITIESDTQVYTIPAGREINEVLWDTPPEIDQGLVDPFALTNWGAGSFGWSYMGRPAQYMQPTYSLLLAAQDRDIKRRILGSELTYRIAGGPNGTKLLFLYPIPGSRSEIRGRFGKHFAGRKVWYFYYDTTEENRDKCIEQNNDIIKLPSDVPLDTLSWDELNSIARQQVRDLFFAQTKMAAGGIRGFYSGSLGSADKELTMDYRHLLDEGESLKEQTTTKIGGSLEKIALVNLMRDRADIAESTNKVMGYVPMSTPIITH